MNNVSNDNDMNNFQNLNSLVNSISDSEQFSLSQSNIDGMMDFFLDIIGVRIDM